MSRSVCAARDCDNPLLPTQRMGRPRRLCSDNYRAREHAARKREDIKAATLTCPQCGCSYQQAVLEILDHVGMIPATK